jgi:hypothetical protein
VVCKVWENVSIAGWAGQSWEMNIARCGWMVDVIWLPFVSWTWRPWDVGALSWHGVSSKM